MSMMDFFSNEGEKPDEEKVKNEDYTKYEEGIYVGYRHFDKTDMEVSYPFGYGLSYTSFQYSDFSVTLSKDNIQVAVTIQNQGSQPGKEVIQIYVSKENSDIDRPEQELKGFAKTQTLKPDEKEEITIHIPISTLSYWDEHKDEWTLEKGQYNIKAGASSRDIRITKIINLED